MARHPIASSPRLASRCGFSIEAEALCRRVLRGVCISLSFPEEIVNVVCPKPLGEGVLNGGEWARGPSAHKCGVSPSHSGGGCHEGSGMCWWALLQTPVEGLSRNFSTLAPVALSWGNCLCEAPSGSFEQFLQLSVAPWGAVGTGLHVA